MLVSHSFLSCVLKESASDKERRDEILHGHLGVIYSGQIIIIKKRLVHSPLFPLLSIRWLTCTTNSVLILGSS